MTAKAGLKLLAEDSEDLTVISEALQDAVVKVGDIQYAPRSRTLTMLVNRYRWEDAGSRRRVRSGLQIGSVLNVQVRKIRRRPRDAVLELLAVDFEASDQPGGWIRLTFAGGGDLRVAVECVDAVLADISQAWSTRREPGHESDL